VMAYSVGLLGFILVKVLAPGFYARQDIKTPVKIAIFTLILTQVMNLIFVHTLHFDHWGLALATKINAIFIPMTLGVWWLIFRREKRLLNRLIIMGFTAIPVFMAVWPWL